MSSRQHFTVFEYGHLVSETDSDRVAHAVALPARLFEWLEQRALRDDAENTHRLLTLRSRGGVKTLQVKNYAGVIALPGNSFIEVLPKTGHSEENVDIARQQLLMMLRTLKSFRHIATSTSSIRTSKMPLLDVFIQQFIDSVQQIVRQGLKRDYLRLQDNLPWMKGKLQISAQLTKNCIRKDRFQVEFDEYNVERPENRILKTALAKVYRQTRHPQLLQQLRPLQAHFEDIPSINDVRVAFDQVRLDRHMHHYEHALAWARLILLGQSPHCMQGESSAISLLFPMEAVFESFVTAWMRHHYRHSWHVEPQVYEHKLVRFNSDELFGLWPDIKLRPREGSTGATIVCDIKWKIADDRKAQLDQSRDDLFQMLAYGVNYLQGNGDMLLIYPAHDHFNQPLQMPYEFCNTGIRLWIVPFYIGETLQASELRLPDALSLQ